VDKFIIHSRKCLLNGFTPKQNRDIPPLKYDVVHRLVTDFPELKFIINGGISTFSEIDTHLFGEYEGHPPVHGVMLGRAVQNDPFMLAAADSTYFGQRDPGLSRRACMERYMDYCDFMQSPEGPVQEYRDKRVVVSPAVMVKAVHHVFRGCKGNGYYRRAMDEIYIKKNGKYEDLKAREIVSAYCGTVFILCLRLIFLIIFNNIQIEAGMSMISDEFLDAPIGNPLEREIERGAAGSDSAAESDAA
jgi:tRNA-dihydrouridine synthase